MVWLFVGSIHHFGFHCSRVEVGGRRRPYIQLVEAGLEAVQNGGWKSNTHDYILSILKI